jgi:hypothetical protein
MLIPVQDAVSRANLAGNERGLPSENLAQAVPKLKGQKSARIMPVRRTGHAPTYV